MFNNKKVFIIIFLIILIINNWICIVKADDIDEEDTFIDEVDIIETLGTNAEEPNINSKAAVIYDRTSKKVMWGKNENKVRAMASTTKIMTAIVVLENSNLNDIVTISKKAALTGGSRLKINTGDKISVNDLLYGLMLKSGNDAAVALAEHVGGNIENFASMMNKKASQLGLKNTCFTSPHGLDDDNHFTTAYELAILTDYALSNDKFAKIVNTKSTLISVNGVGRTISNTNELLGNLNGVDGVKTGFTGNAGRCLVASCTRDNNQIITVVLGADTKKYRTQDSIKLIEYAFKNYERINIEEIVKEEYEKWKQINEKRIYINKGRKNFVELEVETINNKIIPLKIGSKKDIKVEINCIYNLDAPILKEAKVGNIIVKNNNEIIEIVDIKVKEEIKKNSILDYMNLFFSKIANEKLMF